MRDSTERRIKLARGGVLMFVLTLGWSAWQNAGEALVSAETPPPALIRLEWFGDCDPARGELGLYRNNDSACSPSRTASLAWLQSQLTLIGVLSAGEYLQRAPTPSLPACGALVLAPGGDAHAGWICVDTHGVYRADMTGMDTRARWQLLNDGAWIFMQP